MRSALRDAEATPPADGWARLERELAPAPRISALRRYWPRIAAAAAAVSIFVGGGGYLLHENRDFEDKGFVIAAATDSGSSAADIGGQPADGAGTLGGKVRSVLPSEDAVRAATLPGAEPRAAAIPLAARRAELVAVAGAPVETPAGMADTKTEKNTSAGWTPGVETAADNAPAEQSGKQDVAGQVRGAQDARNKAGVGEQVARTRAYPGMSDYFAEQPTGHKPARRKTSVSLFAAGGVTASSGAGGSVPNLMMSDVLFGGTNSAMAQLKYNYEDYSFRHHQPLSFGLTVRKEFAHGLSLESGVNYTLLWSDVRMQSGREDITQKLHFIGVPLRLNWQFLERGRFSLYIGAGGMAEKCVAAKFGSKSVDEPKVQWSVTGAAGAQYRLGNLVGLYFEPEVSHYFTETALRTSRTDASVSLTLRLGVRLSF